jgi:DNA-binding transcriptional LysR family regulator
MLNLAHWKLLVAVADAGSISKAAERSSITQSGASQAITQLEEALGVQLFIRERRRTTATAIGAKVLEHAREMLARLEAIQAVANDARGLRTGRIRLASFPSVFARLLPPLVRTFRRLHPGIEIVALEGSDVEVESWLQAETVDLGVVMNPGPEQEGLSLGRDTWVAVVPKQHALGKLLTGSKVALSALVGEPFILATGGCTVNAGSLARSAGLSLTNVRVTVHDWLSAFNLVREGLGIALMPESTLPEDQRGTRIIHLKIPIYRNFTLVCSRSAALSPAVHAFLSLIAAGPSGYSVSKKAPKSRRSGDERNSRTRAGKRHA